MAIEEIAMEAAMANNDVIIVVVVVVVVALEASNEAYREQQERAKRG